MTRRGIYTFGFVVTLACTAMTIASIVEPRWLSYGSNDKRQYSMGLHSRCSTVTGTCKHFPQYDDCVGDKWGFCSMWRTVGFLLSFSVVVELCMLVSFIVIVVGGVQRRVTGWKVLSPLLAFGGIVQCAGMAIVAFLYDHDERFFDGWYLDLSFTLATISWSLLVLTGLGIAASAIYLPAEGDYELIPDPLFTSDETEQ
ncbi:hypothetical protein EJ04DRAFT_531552 [Polyplosphaeria fusca]|uniref:Uncharacterized protein n=1 Tax=Polyplosphaeria fusca TaxID=682080 RepID=A0A9P4R6A2_9PLEO|nr:hypothetical protein EJ04DRAFT_531552 [Polyplosphaeria fusca]